MKKLMKQVDHIHRRFIREGKTGLYSVELKETVEDVLQDVEDAKDFDGKQPVIKDLEEMLETIESKLDTPKVILEFQD
jgi:hypothetical protein